MVSKWEFRVNFKTFRDSLAQSEKKKPQNETTYLTLNLILEYALLISPIPQQEPQRGRNSYGYNFEFFRCRVAVLQS